MAKCFSYVGAAIAVVVLAGHSWATASDRSGIHPLAVVVHRSSTVDNLASADLRRILTGDRLAWPDSSATVVVEQPEDSATQQRMLRTLLKTTPAGYRRQLLELQFQGKDAPAIKVLNSDETALKFVWNVPGAVAVIDAALAASAPSRVKVLRLDGKLPGEPGYPLQ
jgi:ABC-type phosphate transport system substrate-binding protein